MMRLLVVNYHYLRYPGKKFLVSRGVKEKIFEKQLKRLRNWYQPITFRDYQLLAEQRKKQGNYLIVTFDDGLKDGLRAWAIAKRLNFPLTFFVAGLPLAEQKILTSQKIHLLLEKINYRSLAEIFYKELKKYQGVKRRKEEELGISNLYQFDRGRLKRLKSDLNFLLPHQIRDEIINKIFKKYYPQERRLAENLYLSYKDLKKILKENGEIGGHSYAHLVLSFLSRPEQEEEIKKCREVLNKVSRDSLPFAVPFGYLATFNKTTKRLLKKYNFFNLVTMEKRININNYDQYNIARFDQKDIFL